MASGKRYDTTEPLTEHDLADRIDKAALRLWRILSDVRQLEGEDGYGKSVMEQVKHSRYLSNVPAALVHELTVEWGIKAHEMPPAYVEAPAVEMPSRC